MLAFMAMDDVSGSATLASTRFERACRRFDEANACDPNVEVFAGEPWPRELLYARRLSDWVSKLAPNASEELRLAARCQHLCRWMIPRPDYEATKAGYLRWRAELKSFHANKAGEILREAGYPEEITGQVQSLNLKKNFPHDPDSRVLEDALCLIFLEHQFADLATRTTDEKMVNALRKSWQKMTPAGHAHALALPFGPREKTLLEQALRAAPGS